MNVPKVAILLSTFNGEAYLERLLNSLLSQDYENFHIFVRDDGSSDGTLDILKRFSRNEQINCLYSENIGVVKSFFSLLEQCPIDADYYALIGHCSRRLKKQCPMHFLSKFWKKIVQIFIEHQEVAQ